MDVNVRLFYSVHPIDENYNKIRDRTRLTSNHNDLTVQNIQGVQRKEVLQLGNKQNWH